MVSSSGRLMLSLLRDQKARVMRDPYLNSPIVQMSTSSESHVVKHTSKKRLQPPATEASPPMKKANTSPPTPAFPNATTSDNASFTHTPPSDPTLTGEPFFRQLLATGQLRALDGQRFYCACRPAGWAAERGKVEGISHWQKGRSWCRARWADHARKCEERK